MFCEQAACLDIQNLRYCVAKSRVLLASLLQRPQVYIIRRKKSFVGTTAEPFCARRTVVIHFAVPWNRWNGDIVGSKYEESKCMPSALPFYSHEKHGFPSCPAPF